MVSRGAAVYIYTVYVFHQNEQREKCFAETVSRTPLCIIILSVFTHTRDDVGALGVEFQTREKKGPFFPSVHIYIHTKGAPFHHRTYIGTTELGKKRGTCPLFSLRTYTFTHTKRSPYNLPSSSFRSFPFASVL